MCAQVRFIYSAPFWQWGGWKRKSCTKEKMKRGWNKEPEKKEGKGKRKMQEGVRGDERLCPEKRRDETRQCRGGERRGCQKKTR